MNLLLLPNALRSIRHVMPSRKNPKSATFFPLPLLPFSTSQKSSVCFTYGGFVISCRVCASTTTARLLPYHNFKAKPPLWQDTSHADAASRLRFFYFKKSLFHFDIFKSSANTAIGNNSMNRIHISFSPFSCFLALVYIFSCPINRT